MGETGARMAEGLVREREKAMGYLEVTGEIIIFVAVAL